MRRSIIIILALLCTLLVSGCMTLSNLSVANSATISEANFHVVRPIEKEFTATYIICFGGEAKRKAVEKAVLEMTEELQPNQALAYINVVESNWIPIIPIVFKQTTHVSAVIIEYDK